MTLYKGTECIAGYQGAANIVTQMSNCILEDPQNINLELSNGTLTLKAGSIVCVPNGFESDGTTPKFTEVTISSDKVLTDTWGNAEQMIFIVQSNGSAITWAGSGRFSSGTTAPTATSTQYWYDTNTNFIKLYTGGSYTGNNYSFPIAVGTKTSSSNDAVVASVDTTFQSIGYIGSTVFVRKGLKVLIPDGKNNVGSLKNIEYTTTSVKTRTATFSGDTVIGFNTDITWASASSYYYDEFTNTMYSQDGTVWPCCLVARANFTSGVISNFELAPVVNLLKYGDVYNKSEVYTKTESDSRYVNVTGDTMTGNLNFNIGTYPKVYTASPLDTSTSSDTFLVGLQRGSTANGRSLVYQEVNSSLNTIYTHIQIARVINGQQYFNGIGVGIDSNGKSVFTLPQIITDYVSGTSGYRIWSNGYCEQWGITTSRTSGTADTISFLKTFANTNYNVQLTIEGYKGGSDVNIRTDIRYTSSMTIYAEEAETPINWKACGYLASGQY